MQKNIRAAFDVLRAGEFFRRVADAADAGDEDHPYRTDPGNLLRIVSCAAGHQFGRESQFFGVIVNQLLKARIRQCRMSDQRFGEAEGSSILAADLL